MKTLLHIGCGPNRIDRTTKGFSGGGWKEVRLDIDPGVSPDIIGTMTEMSAVSDRSVDAIFSSHNIEHLFAHEIPVALAEFRRVLRDDGFCVITCPDLKSVSALIAQDKLTDTAYESPAGPITPLDILYGHRGMIAQGNAYMAHRCGFTESVLGGTLSVCGFRSIASMTRAAAFDIWALASKSEKTEDDLRRLASEHFPI